MGRRRTSVHALAFVLVSTWLNATAAPPAPPRIVAIGDIHGAHDEFLENLRRSGLVDESGRWSGGRTVFVQTGDYFDRGAKVREVLDLLMALQPQAEGAGGRAEILLGNHEAMNLIGETRDVNPDVFARFADSGSEARRQEAWDAYLTLAKKRAAEFASVAGGQLPVPAIYQPPSREEWLAAHPPGFIEYLDALGPTGVYGQWLRARSATVKVGETIFLHGGFNPDTAPKTLDAANEQVRREIALFDRARALLVDREAALPFFRFQEILDASRALLDLARAQAGAGSPTTFPPDLAPLAELTRIGTWSLINPNGPLWFRGFATWSSEEGRPKVQELLDRYQAARFVVGHTIPASFRITPRFADHVYLIDTGMLSTVYKGGRASALEIADSRVTAIYAEERVVLTGTATAGVARQ
jgi:hypothetical protein